ncbi:MAG: hypothetical protein KA715_00420 [Xanthomonadaceae bacterium]|nr:hypothetical protein [Xanthomonadaceae bacterium]
MKKKLALLITYLMSHTAMAVDLPESISFSQTHKFANGLQIEVTTAIIDENDDDAWIKFFSNKFEADLKKNPNLLTHFETIETEGREPQSKKTSGKKRVRKFAEEVSKNKAPIKHGMLSPSFWSKRWRSEHGAFFEENKARINATVLRFVFNSAVNAFAIVVGDDPVAVTAAIAGGVLIGSLSASTAWFFDFIADKIVGEPKLSNFLFKNKGSVYNVSAWLENLFNWGKVELVFLSLIKVGFIAMGITSYGELGPEIAQIILATGLGALSQGTWETSIMQDRKKLIAEGESAKQVQKRTQYLALAGSVLAVMGTVATTFKMQILGYEPGYIVLSTLGAAGLINLARINKNQIKDMGTQILNHCSKKLEQIKTGIKKSDKDQSNNWVISPVQCSV